MRLYRIKLVVAAVVVLVTCLLHTFIGSRSLVLF